MPKQNKSPPAQSSMFEAFAAAEQDAKTAHMPGEMDQAIEYYRGILERHHAAVMACDLEAAQRLQQEADDLAIELNGGTNFGIIGGPDAPGCVLERETAAPEGTIPLYGQLGNFIVEVRGTKVRIEMDGIFGIGAMTMVLPAFAAHAVDWNRPFISETGYRSFLGYRVHFDPGTPPDQLARSVLETYIAQDCKGKLRAIQKRYSDLHLQPQEPAP